MTGTEVQLKKNGFELPKSALVNKIAKSDRLRMFEKRNYAFKSNLRGAFFYFYFFKKTILNVEPLLKIFNYIYKSCMLKMVD
jgi:hypothetical protein